MQAEWKARIFLVVLGADGENDTARAQRQRPFLQSEIGFSQRAALPQFDALHAVIADHAAPQHIVKIENKAFAAAPAQGADKPCYVIGIKRHESLGKRNLLRPVPLRRVVPRGRARCFGQ